MKVVKGEVKLQFSDDTVYLENLDTYVLELLPTVRKFNKITVYKINIQKLLTFMYINSRGYNGRDEFIIISTKKLKYSNKFNKKNLRHM